MGMQLCRVELLPGQAVGVEQEGMRSSVRRIVIRPTLATGYKLRPLCVVAINVDGQTRILNAHRFPIEFSGPMGGEIAEQMARPGARLMITNVAGLLAGFSVELEYSMVPRLDAKNDGSPPS